MKEGLKAELLDRCQRKEKMIYRVRNGFRKIESLKSNLKSRGETEKKLG